MNVISGLLAVFCSIVLANGEKTLISKLYMDSPGYCSVNGELNEVKDRETIFVYGGRHNKLPKTSRHYSCELKFKAGIDYEGGAHIKVAVVNASFAGNSLGYLEVYHYDPNYKASVLKLIIDRRTTFLPNVFVSRKDTVTLYLFRGGTTPSYSSKYFFTVRITADIEDPEKTRNSVTTVWVVTAVIGVFLCIACCIARNWTSCVLRGVRKRYLDKVDEVLAMQQAQSLRRNSKHGDSHEKSVTILVVTKPFKIPRPTVLDDTEPQE